MSLGVRPTLRPVIWSEVDAHGHNLRRARSSEDEEYVDSAESPLKKTKVVGQPAVYYPPTLSPAEVVWKQRYGYLYQKGYQLRPRYHPEWTPTKTGNSRHYHSGEDHIMQILPQVLDAIRSHDGLVVCIKMIQDERKIKQIAITQYFSSRKMTEDTRNHVVPCYDAFVDCYSPQIEFIVMPVLRRFDDPEFIVASEVMDFVSQVIEGLVFLHENNVAHHNITADHIMMDAKALIPTGWHFVSHFCEPDGMARIRPLDRKNYSVRYYFVGFGSCYHISPDVKPLVRDIGGNDDDVPELKSGNPYDPYKLDVYTLGNVLMKELYNKYHGLDFIYDLIAYMRDPDFEKRPDAAKVLRHWYNIRDALDEEEMEEVHLRYRKGQASKQNHSPTSSRGSNSHTEHPSRSQNRDISSIINRSSTSTLRS